MRLERVEARGVSKIYGRHRALSKVDLILTPGKVTGLLGPNGSGKTTLLMLFSTLSLPSGGTMHFGDLPPRKASSARGAIGLVSHAPLTYGDLTALENITFFAKLYGVKSPAKVAEALLARFDLEDALHRPARTFSRGMLQRLGLARALVGDPQLVLLDEPFTGLDRTSCRIVMDEVRLLREAGAMVLMISHDLATTAELADEVVVLRRGRVAARHGEAMDADTLRARYAAAAEPSEPEAAA